VEPGSAWFGAAAVATLILAATGGTHHLSADLIVYVVLAAVTGVVARGVAVP